MNGIVGCQTCPRCRRVCSPVRHITIDDGCQHCGGRQLLPHEISEHEVAAEQAELLRRLEAIGR